MAIERKKSIMRELSTNEIQTVSGGIRTTVIRFVIGQGVKLAAKTILSEKHSGGDACDYYNNMPAGMQ